MALDVELSREQFLRATPDFEMDGRSARDIRHGLDRSEQALTRRPGEETPKTLEMMILFGAVRRVAGVQVNAIGVAPPDFDEGIANRISPGIKNPPAHPRDLAHGGRKSIVDHEQVVVRVERQMVGIGRTFSGRWSPPQRLRKGAGSGEE